MKKHLCFLLITILAGSCISCGPKDEPKNPEAAESRNESIAGEFTAEVEWLPATLEEVLANATGVCIGKFLFSEEAGSVRHFVFSVEKAYWGEFPDGTATVEIDPAYPELQTYAGLAENERVLLVLERQVSVLNSEDIVLPFYHSFLPLDRLEDARMADGALENLTETGLLTLCEEYAGKNGIRCYGHDYIRSGDAAEIVAASPVIVRVRIGGTAVSSEAADRKTVTATVLETLKGQPTPQFIVITLLNEWGLESGQEYILAVEFYEDTVIGSFYGLTSKAAYWSADRADEILELLPAE